jgi:hypothetical protein
MVVRVTVAGVERGRRTADQHSVRNKLLKPGSRLQHGQQVGTGLTESVLPTARLVLGHSVMISLLITSERGCLADRGQRRIRTAA